MKKGKRLILALIISIITIAIIVYVVTQKEDKEDQQQVEVVNTDSKLEEQNTESSTVGNTVVNIDEVIEGIVDETETKEDGDGDSYSSENLYNREIDKLSQDGEALMEKLGLDAIDKDKLRLIIESNPDLELVDVINIIHPGLIDLVEKQEALKAEQDAKGDTGKVTEATKPIKTETASGNGNSGGTGGKTSGGSESTVYYDNGDNRTEEQKKADDEYMKSLAGEWSDSTSGDTSHEPTFYD